MFEDSNIKFVTQCKECFSRFRFRMSDIQCIFSTSDCEHTPWVDTRGHVICPCCDHVNYIEIQMYNTPSITKSIWMHTTLMNQ